MEGVLARLKDAGAVLVEGDIRDVGRLDNEAGFPIALYETVADLDAYLAGHGSPMRYRELVAQCASPDVAGLLQSLHGEGAIPEAAYRHALTSLRPQLQAAYRDHFKRHDVVAHGVSDDATAGGADRRRRNRRHERRARADLSHFHPQHEPGQRGGDPGHQPAGGDDARRPAARPRARRARRRDAALLAIARAVEAVLPKMPAPPKGLSDAARFPKPLPRSQRGSTRRKQDNFMSHDFIPARRRILTAAAGTTVLVSSHRLRPVGVRAAEGIQDRLLHRAERPGVAVRPDPARLRRPRRREDQQGGRDHGPSGQADLHRRRRPAGGDREVGGAPDARGQGRSLHRLARQRDARGEHRDHQGQGALHLFAGLRGRRVLAERLLPGRDTAAAGAAGDRVPGQGEEREDLLPDRRRLRLAAQVERADQEVHRPVRRQGRRRGIRSVRRAEQVRGGGDAHQGQSSPTR